MIFSTSWRLERERGTDLARRVAVLVVRDDDLGQVDVPDLPGDQVRLPATRRDTDEVEIDRGAAVTQQPHQVLQGHQAGLGLGLGGLGYISHPAVFLTKHPRQAAGKSRLIQI